MITSQNLSSFGGRKRNMRLNRLWNTSVSKDLQEWEEELVTFTPPRIPTGFLKTPPPHFTMQISTTAGEVESKRRVLMILSFSGKILTIFQIDYECVCLRENSVERILFYLLNLYATHLIVAGHRIIKSF